MCHYTPHFTRPTPRAASGPPRGWTTHQPNPRQSQTSLHVWQTVAGYARCLSRDRYLSVLFVDPQQRPPELFWLPTYYILYDQSIGARSTLRVLVVLTYIAQKQAAITTRLSFQVFFLSFLISFLSLEFFLDFLSTYQFPNPLRAEEPHLGLSTTTKASSAHQLHDFIILIGHCTDFYDPKRTQGSFDS